MNQPFTAHVQKSGDGWIGWIEGVPGINAQERTESSVRQSLRQAFAESMLVFKKDHEKDTVCEYGYSHIPNQTTIDALQDDSPGETVTMEQLRAELL